jgi:hypothetical protein
MEDFVPRMDSTGQQGIREGGDNYECPRGFSQFDTPGQEMACTYGGPGWPYSGYNIVTALLSSPSIPPGDAAIVEDGAAASLEALWAYGKQ